ncbi:MAG TPA: hypothetical protein DDX92_09680 [Flavobacteriales bacterium]|jgi:tetratricopeptide (TPR) repeat protein|nr:hypothetical protein [Flavobacteriales bacterium]
MIFRYFTIVVIVASVLSCNSKTSSESTEESDNQKVDTIQLINAAIKIDPSNDSLYLAKAEYFIRNGQVRYAWNEFDRAIQTDTMDAELYFKKAKALFDQRLYAESVEVTLKALEKDPNHAESLVLMGWHYFLVQNYPSGLEQLNMALEQDMYLSEAYFLKGLIYYERKDYAKAASNLKTAVEQDNDYYEAWLELGFLYDEQSDTLAPEFFKNAIRVRPESTEAMYALAMHYQNREKLSEAITWYDELLEIDPQYKDAWFNIGYLYMIYGANPDSSIFYFDKVIALDKLDYRAHYNKGLYYEQSGQSARAREQYEKALEIKPDYDLAARGLNRLGL